MRRATLLAAGAALATGAGLATLASVQLGTTDPATEGLVRAQARPAQGRIPLPEVIGAASRSLGSARTDPFFLAPPPAPPPLAVTAPPAPVVAVVTPPPPPPAPPFPFEFVGQIAGSKGAPVVFLSKGEQLLEVQGRGDLGDGYEVDELTNEHIVVIHVASQQTSIYEFGPRSEPEAIETAVAPPPPTLEVALAAPASAKVGDTFEIPVHVKSGFSLRGLPVEIAYDRERLKLIDWGEGPFLRSGGVATSIARSVGAPAGSVDIGILRNTPDGARGEGVLATLRFKAVAQGQAEVRFTRVNPLGIDRMVDAPALPPPVSVSILQ